MTGQTTLHAQDPRSTEYVDIMSEQTIDFEGNTIKCPSAMLKKEMC